MSRQAQRAPKCHPEQARSAPSRDRHQTAKREAKTAPPQQAACAYPPHRRTPPSPTSAAPHRTPSTVARQHPQTHAHRNAPSRTRCTTPPGGPRTPHHPHPKPHTGRTRWRRLRRRAGHQPVPVVRVVFLIRAPCVRERRRPNAARSSATLEDNCAAAKGETCA